MDSLFEGQLDLRGERARFAKGDEGSQRTQKSLLKGLQNSHVISFFNKHLV